MLVAAGPLAKSSAHDCGGAFAEAVNGGGDAGNETISIDASVEDECTLSSITSTMPFSTMCLSRAGNEVVAG